MENQLTDLKESLKLLLGDSLIKMVLFGSRARGDYDEDSDIDIAIIVRSLSKELKNEIFNQVAEIELKYLRSISSIIFSETEFNRLKERERRVALDIESEGILL
ncbi:MAG TPA: nucleotidyltransferase domain-containing protein [Spirochaetales bacterium]|nr:nucleotidyltransferase domain-containing protein [Spirochaetales bacterium]